LVNSYFAPITSTEKDFNCDFCKNNEKHEVQNILESSSDILIIEILREKGVRNIY
jgi:hypothetical protein